MKLLLLALVFMLFGCGTAPQPTPISIPLASPPRSVIVDTDLATDDMLALLYLLSRPDVNVKAITISGTGITRCGAGLQNARVLLETTNHENIPLACGRETPLQGNHLFPTAWRDAAENFFGLKLKPSNPNPLTHTAVALLTHTLYESDGINTILALGPLTNLADALSQDRSLTSKIKMIYSMGGAVNVAGNVERNAAAEWNFYIDPFAAQQVIASAVPFTLVPLDATNHVPVTRAFLDRMSAPQATRAAQLAKQILDTQHTDIENGTFYFWDPVTAAILTDETLGEVETRSITVATSNDADSGRIALTDDGTPVRIAVDIDRARFEQTFLQTLNGQFK